MLAKLIVKWSRQALVHMMACACVLISDDLTYAGKNTEVAWIYWIFWKQSMTSVIYCRTCFYLQKYLIIFHFQYFLPYVITFIYCCCESITLKFYFAHGELCKAHEEWKAMNLVYIFSVAWDVIVKSQVSSICVCIIHWQVGIVETRMDDYNSSIHTAICLVRVWRIWHRDEILCGTVWCHRNL